MRPLQRRLEGTQPDDEHEAADWNQSAANAQGTVQQRQQASQEDRDLLHEVQQQEGERPAGRALQREEQLQEVQEQVAEAQKALHRQKTNRLTAKHEDDETAPHRADHRDHAADHR